MQKLKIDSIDQLVDLCWMVCCRWVIFGILVEIALGLSSIAIHLYGPDNLSNQTVFLIVLLYQALDVIAWCGTFYLAFRSAVYKKFS